MCGGDGTRFAGDASRTVETGEIYDNFVIFAVFDVKPGKVTFCFTTYFRFEADLS